MHPNSELLFEKYAKSLFKDNMRVLEIGPERHPSTYQKIVGNDTITWETLDMISDEELTYRVESEYAYPIPSETFDIIISGQVIEHIKKVWLWVEELARVSKVGGKVITIGPVSWPYHEAPVDCWRIYPEGMKALYEHAGLNVELSISETLEVTSTASRRLVPATSFIPQPIYKSVVKRLLGWPIPYSIDTITIGVKEFESGKN